MTSPRDLVVGMTSAEIVREAPRCRSSWVVVCFEGAVTTAFAGL
jgi:hypothetical protein